MRPTLTLLAMVCASAGSAWRIGDADFVPPHAALLHAQFETIHPFIDGNGRTGRVLVHTVLRGHGITRHTTVPVSAGVLRATDRYFTALGAYRDGDPSPIVTEMSAAALAAVATAVSSPATSCRSARSGGTRSRPAPTPPPGGWRTSSSPSR